MADYSSLFDQAGKQFNVDPALAQAVMLAESGGDPSAVSPKMAVGPMQLMPETARGLGVDPTNPAQNIVGGVKYLGQLLDKYGDVPTALAAYNAGPGAVDKHGGIPPFPETQKYVQTVMAKYQPKAAQSTQADMPGLPPSGDSATPGVDPFAGLPGAAGSASHIPPATGAAAPVDPFAGLPAPSKAGVAPATQAKPDTTPWDSLTRQVGLTARAGVSALTGLPTIAGDALNGAINLGIHGVNSLAGTNIASLQMPSQVIQKGMNAIGVPQPQNATERVVQGVTSAMGGVAPFAKAGQLLANAASPAVVGAAAAPVAQAVGNGMAALPGMQITGAAGSAAAGGIARENGVGPLGQIGYGVLGGLAGAVAPSAALAAARGVKAAASNIGGVAQPLLNPKAYVGNQLAQTIGTDAPGVAANLQNVPEFVANSSPTTAQAAGGPVLVATEKAFANANPEFKNALAAREASNNAARWDAINGVARTEADLSQAMADRAAVTKPMYDAAHAQIVPIDDSLTTLATRPAIKQAMQSADLLAKNEGVPIQWPTPQNPQISGKALDYTNRALSDLIGTAKAQNNPEQVKALTGAQSLLQGWMEKNVPGLREASSDYAAFSSPVNTMQAGQQIAQKLSGGAQNVAKQPQITLPAFKSALAQALKGQDHGIDAQAQAALENITKDLQRSSVSGALRSPGSDTAYNIAANGWLGRQIYGKNFGGATGLGRTLGAIGATVTGHPYIGLGLLSQGNKLGQMAGNRLNEQLSQFLLQPESLLPYVQAVQPQEAAQALLPLTRRNVVQGLLGAAATQRAQPVN
jgi:hypothetical protein